MKKTRQEKILELILQKEIETQDDLCKSLNEEGFVVTQATVSRDIRDLKLIKVAGTKGRMKYASLLPANTDFAEKYRKIFREGFVSADTAGNILVIKTISGMAMAVAAALDAMNFAQIVGSIAGDDTIMCAIRTPEDAEKIRIQLLQLSVESD